MECHALSLHDALPIWPHGGGEAAAEDSGGERWFYSRCRKSQDTSGGADRDPPDARIFVRDRKSTRLNSSHMSISYAVFCLKKKNMIYGQYIQRCPVRP